MLHYTVQPNEVMSKKPSSNRQIICTNRKARFQYHLEEVLEAGIALEGWEVTSMRQHKAQIQEGHIHIYQQEAFLNQMHIQPSDQTSQQSNADPLRRRKLLLHRREINRLIGSIKQKGYTLVPIEAYWKGRHIKIKIALAKGKKQHDKRETIKNRDWQREQARTEKYN